MKTRAEYKLSEHSAKHGICRDSHVSDKNRNSS